jgi:hypothetical protein
MVHISLVPALTPLYLYVSTFRSMCAVPNMAVFCSSLTSWFPGLLLTYFLNNFEIVPVAPIIIIIIIIALTSWELSAYACQIEISETLACLMSSLNVETMLPLDALWRQIDSDTDIFNQSRFITCQFPIVLLDNSKFWSIPYVSYGTDITRWLCVELS